MCQIKLCNHPPQVKYATLGSRIQVFEPYALKLHIELQYPLIEADTLRTVAHREKTKAEEAFVYLGTTEAWQQFGKPTPENVTKGLVAVRRAMRPYVSKEIEKFPNTLIMEAAFLDPHDLAGIGERILIVTTSEEQHQLQYFRHRERNSYHAEVFRVARILQEYLIQEASVLGVSVVENNLQT
mgnify:CR=1 FL=1